MIIKVKTLTGKEIEIDIDADDKIERVKERVEEKEGIPPQQQRLDQGCLRVGNVWVPVSMYSACATELAPGWPFLALFIPKSLNNQRTHDILYPNFAMKADVVNGVFVEMQAFPLPKDKPNTFIIKLFFEMDVYTGCVAYEFFFLTPWVGPG